jgi:hypothetical protein
MEQDAEVRRSLRTPRAAGIAGVLFALLLNRQWRDVDGLPGATDRPIEEFRDRADAGALVPCLAR